jgi:23S rRNA pseudouridine2605 synthase
LKERIQKILASRGVASRRACEELIIAGRVSCNGTVCTLGQTADPDIDVLLVDGCPIPVLQKPLYLMLHKPKGYVTTMSDEKGRKNVSELVVDCPQRVYPVGRLDMDSEGLLIMTNDGDFANKLMHPSHEVDKVYRVTVKGYSNAALELVKRPIVLDGYKIKKPKVEILSVCGGQAQLLITIHEGRNRQVRRMCAAADMQVKKLVRVAEGRITLGQLECGKWRYLTDEELSLL